MSKELDPLKEYRRRHGERTNALQRHIRKFDFIANARLAIVLLGIVVAGLSFGAHRIHFGWLAIPIVAFAALVILHERVMVARRIAQSAVDYYTRAIARVEGHWAGTGWDGVSIAPVDHPCANDLDIFGPDSLFQLLCTTQTQAGGKVLGEWLCAPASADEIRARQAAVEELRPRIDLREELAYSGQVINAGVLPEFIEAWAAAEPVFHSRRLPILAYITSAAILLSIWAKLLPLFTFAAVALSALHMTTRTRTRKVAGAAAGPGRELEIVSGVLARLEKESFNCPYLQRIQEDLKDETQLASAAIGRLVQLIRLKDASLNMLFAPISAVLMWDFHLARAIDRWRVKHAAAITRWLADVGRLEALCALASYAYERPGDPFPTIVDDGPVFRGQGLGHPLLPADDCVRNSVALDASNRLLIVSGSNMSGKSFLLRTVGINAVLACAGAPVCAHALTISPLRVGATLNVHDSIQAGVSRFYAEIKRIRMLMDIAAGPIPLLFLLDEIMHGTNSWDRRIGASAILKGFLQAGAIGITTTHDLAITELANEIGAISENAHLEDQLKDGQLDFDYLLRPGVVTRSNALDLMRAIGLKID